MKIATLAREREPFVAVVDSERGVFWPLREFDTRIKADADMVSVIEHLVRNPLRFIPQSPGEPLRNVKLRAPILKPPRNIFCVGKNYRDHAKEFHGSGYDQGAAAAEATPEHPIVFTKPWTSIAGPDEDIPLTSGLDQAVDYEAELAVIIGKPGQGIPAAEALQHVFGYTILNDVTARDLQRRHQQWYLGKALDGFGPMGPCITER